MYDKEKTPLRQAPEKAKNINFVLITDEVRMLYTEPIFFLNNTIYHQYAPLVR